VISSEGLDGRPAPSSPPLPSQSFPNIHTHKAQTFRQNWHGGKKIFRPKDPVSPQGVRGHDSAAQRLWIAAMREYLDNTTRALGVGSADDRRSHSYPATARCRPRGHQSAGAGTLTSPQSEASYGIALTGFLTWC
jgi:hypothetical protein